MNITRRRFLGTMAGLGAIAATSRAAKWSTLSRSIKEAKAQEKDENLIALISDLHCNPDGYQPGKLRKVVQSIISLRPLPAQLVAFGDLAYLTGQEKEYENLRKILKPIEDAGIKMTLGMGNHDRRDIFGKVFPEYADTLVKDRYVHIVKTPYADLIMLDSLQQGADTSTWITEGAVNDEQKEWLKKTLSTYTKPVFVCAHHPIGETRVNTIMLESPTCCGYIYGHNHRWDKDWFKLSYSSTRMIRTLCLPSTGHWGDIGFATMRFEKDSATVKIHQDEFFFPSPMAEDKPIPETWKMIVKEHQNEECSFSYEI